MQWKTCWMKKQRKENGKTGKGLGLKNSLTDRKTKKENVIVAGTNLYNAAKPILTQLKGIFGTSNLKYTLIQLKFL